MHGQQVLQVGEEGMHGQQVIQVGVYKVQGGEFIKPARSILNYEEGK